jgi:hypothetical protein
VTQLVAGVAAVRKDVAQPRIKPADRNQHSDGTISILSAGDMHDQSDEVTGRVGDDVPLAALDLFAGVKAARTAALRGLTDWLSMTSAVVLACRPAFSRDAITRAWLINSQRPSRTHA